MRMKLSQGGRQIVKSRETETHNGDARAFRKPEGGENGQRALSASIGPRPAKPVSPKKAEANRRNSQRSTGPKTEAGKAASRLNAVKHGLLAKEIVITRGDFQENEHEFAVLLERLREEKHPVGISEELEVQKIAYCYWRMARAIRCEHGAIRHRTGDIRSRQARRRADEFDRADRLGDDLETNSHGIQALIDGLEEAKEEALHGKLSREALNWLEETFPDAVLLLDETKAAPQFGDEDVVVPPEHLRKLVNEIDGQLRRLALVREEVVRLEELDLDSKAKSAALPASGVVEKLVRYETSNERELDRALNRLERMQERRRENGREGGGALGGA